MTPYAHAGQTLVTLILISLALWGWWRLMEWCAEKTEAEESKREELLWAKAFVIAYQRVAKEEQPTEYESQPFNLDSDEDLTFQLRRSIQLTERPNDAA